MNLSHVRAECPSCLSVESREELVYRCAARQTNMMLNLRVTARSTSAGPIRPFEAHQPSSESNAATGRPSALTGTTHRDTEHPLRLAPTARVSLTQSHCRSSRGTCTPRQMYSEGSVGQLRARKCRWRQHARGGCKQSVGLEPGLNMRSWHSVKVYDGLCSHCCFAWALPKIICDVSQSVANFRSGWLMRESSRVQFLGTDEMFAMLDDKWTHQKKDKIDTTMTSSRPCWDHSKTTGSLEAVCDSWFDNCQKLTDRCLASSL